MTSEFRFPNAPDPEGVNFFCEHLTTDEETDGHVRYYLGVGANYALVCSLCLTVYQDEAALPTLTPVSQEVFEALDRELCDGVIGAPTFPSVDTNLRFVSQELPCQSAVIAVCGTAGRWYGLSRQGRVLDLRNGEPLCELSLRTVDVSSPIDLYVSGKTVVIANTLGQFGQVHSLIDGCLLMTLDRGTYFPAVSQFPIAFFEDDQRRLLVHAVEWNRLQATCLNSLKPIEFGPAGDEDDYFHAGLSVSPEADWLVSNGWLWHPMGSVRYWNLRQSTAHPALVWREHYWDGPICWVSPHVLAVWGIGDDESWMTPGVQFFDLRSGGKVGWFPGPEISGGELPGAGGRGSSATSSRGFLAFDTYLFAVSPKHGTSVWDPSSGERLLADPDHRPVAYSQGEFLSMDGRTLFISKLGGQR